MRSLPIAAALFLATAVQGLGAERRIMVVVEAQDGMKEAVLARLRESFQASPLFAVREFTISEMSDPIRKGRLLAALQNNDLLVAVGDPATELVLGELEDVPVYFVGGSLVEGDKLASSMVAGMLSYNVDGLLDAARSLWSGKLGLAYTPGYGTIAASIRSGAKTRGFSVVEKKISARQEIPPAMRELMDQAQVVWIVGDPLLARGAGFQFLAERSLSRQMPIVASGAWEVRRGAFLSMEPPLDAMASEAVEAIRSFSEGRNQSEAARIRMAPAGGKILYNGPLAEKWKIRLPAATQWRMLR